MRLFGALDSTSRLLTPDREALLAWYDAQGRSLPWRETAKGIFVQEHRRGYAADWERRVYAVWVSEIMCQQTVIAAVLPYYERWMTRFPTLQDLAQADDQEVLAAWQGLGYYRRCRMLLEGARYVTMNGIPKTAREWLRVPGVGHYTAGAIASICFGEAVPVVDGNVERVYSRIAADASSGSALSRRAWFWATDAVHPSRAGDWNQALMELGAMVCKPRNPDCSRCPLKGACRALETNLVDKLPSPKPKRQYMHVEQSAFYCQQGERIALEQVPSGEWWEGMWRLPNSGLTEPGLKLGSIRHIVTRHKVELHLFRADHPASRAQWFTESEIVNLPVPTPHRRAIELARKASHLTRA